MVYRSAAGSLFPHTPSHTDEYQGELGDCYFISALGTLADSNPAAVQNMFIDNGDGTFTVRFYTGTYGTIYNYSDGSISAGFTNNIGTADYVTVDRMLPTGTTGILAYADYGASYANTANSLWIPLAEKAYAQWNQTGKEGRDGQNAYASIQGGWMATVDAQVLGYNATDYIMTSTSEQVAINALAAKKAVTIGTLSVVGHQLRPLRHRTPTRSSATTRPPTRSPCTIPGGRISRASSPGANSRRRAANWRWPTLPVRSPLAVRWSRPRPSRRRCSRIEYPTSSPACRLPNPPPRRSCHPDWRRRPLPAVSSLPRPARRVSCSTSWGASGRCIRTRCVLPARCMAFSPHPWSTRRSPPMAWCRKTKLGRLSCRFYRRCRRPSE